MSLLLMKRMAVHEISYVSPGHKVRWYFFHSLDTRHGHVTCLSEENEHGTDKCHYEMRC